MQSMFSVLKAYINQAAEFEEEEVNWKEVAATVSSCVHMDHILPSFQVFSTRSTRRVQASSLLR